VSPADGDTVAIHGLRVHGHHGVLPEERRNGQPFVVDAVLTIDTAKAAASDDLADTVDYGTLAQHLAAVVSGEPVQLLETLAGRLADVCLADERVRRVQVTVHKPEAPVGVPVDDITVSVLRTRA
jgi:dihydroneopterin aldolase